ncbi:SDR family oxidoreductase [Streptomyces sp. NPDC007100]|uniref:SDR family oxidoreductase n=1 Tax=Streptomyces sp. NPDC007100 TaxID=3155602 RepID=UPI0033CBB8F1
MAYFLSAFRAYMAAPWAEWNDRLDDVPVDRDVLERVGRRQGVRLVHGIEPAPAQRVLDAGVRRFGRIVTLVDSAGLFLARPFTDYTRAEFDSVVGVNAAGFFHITRLAVLHMLGVGGGHIITIASRLVGNADARVPSVLTPLTQGGLQSATKSLAIEYATRGVRVDAGLAGRRQDAHALRGGSRGPQRSAPGRPDGRAGRHRHANGGQSPDR